MSTQTRMYAEVQEIPTAIERLISQAKCAISDTAADLRQSGANQVMTVARGSSDHAATYLKYACELVLGLPVASVGPSIASVYNASLGNDNAVCIGISQSGQSPDIVKMVQRATEKGATSVAITNNIESPLAHTSRHVIPLIAGPELSVAATKTFVSSLVAGLMLVAHWKQEHALIKAIDSLPDQLDQALKIDWSKQLASWSYSNGMYVVGRGLSFAMANEAALKFKETCQVHAEAFSSAEVLHGPVSLIDEAFPVLALISQDASEDGIADVCDQLSEHGAHVFATSSAVQQARRLECVRTGHPLTDPIPLIVSFYVFVEKLARVRGGNPDQPRHLNKVTKTV